MEYKYSVETRKRMSDAKKKFYNNGGKPWNFGLKAEDDERIKNAVEAAHKALRGKPSPKKGKPAPWAKNLPQQFKKGFTPWNKGKSHMVGKKHWNWKGGIDIEHTRIKQTKKYKDWQQKVYKKYNWTCIDCGIHCKKGNIVAHHIKLFSKYQKLRFLVSNGVVLCRKCHQLRHKPRRKNYYE